MARRSRAEIELVAVNEALSEKLAAFVVDHEATVAELNSELADVIKQRDDRLKWWREEVEKHKATTERANRYEQERDGARDELLRIKLALAGMQADRDQARAHADAMRERAFPKGPEFPWERAGEAINVSGPYDPMTGQWRGY